jgi:glycosyltransferase involved in cell wall biosynthesis
MRVLFLISKNDRYGAQRIFIDQVAAVRDQGHEVHVAARGNEGYVADSVRSLGIPYLGIPMKGLSDIRFLKRFIRDRHIDVVHTTLDRADYYGLLCRALTGVPCVSTMMVPRVHPGYRFMDRIAVLSRMQERLLHARGVPQCKISLVRPGIDVRRFSRPDSAKRDIWRARLRADRFSVVLCHISSMLTRKGHAVSLEVTAQCKHLGQEPLLVIIGDPLEGPYYDQLKQNAVQQGISDNVVFTGWTTDVPEILSLSHFTVLPSEGEALGVVLMEGMAAGTPIVARTGEGGAELIEEHGTGFLYEAVHGAGPVAEWLCGLVRDRARYRAMSERCRSIAADEFSMERFGRRLVALYSDHLQ